MMNEISILTGIDPKVLKTVINKAMLCIGSLIQDAKRENRLTAEIDIGIGALAVEISTMKCKFIPSDELKSAIKTAIFVPKDKLELRLEQSLSERLIAMAKEAI